MIDKDKDMKILNRTGIFQGLKQMRTLVLLQNVVYLLDVAISFVLLLLLVIIKGFFWSTFETQKERVAGQKTIVYGLTRTI